MDDLIRNTLIGMGEKEIARALTVELARFIDRGKKGHCPMADQSTAAQAQLTFLVERDAHRHAAAVYGEVLRLLSATKMAIQETERNN